MIKRIMCAALGILLCFGIFAMIPLGAGAADMHVSDACVELIKQIEGFLAVPVWDYGQWTVGYGTSCPSDRLDRYNKEGIPVEEAETLLAEKLVYFDEKVNDFIKKNKLTLTQGQYDAIFSLTYNCGTSWLGKSEGTLYQAIVNGATGNDFIAAFSAWCTAGGNFMAGLMNRRLAEAEMYLYGKYDRNPPDYYCYVKYNANGGSRSAAGQGYDTRYAAKPTATATYNGYVFQGWYTDPKGGTKVTQLNESHHGMTLYAHWVEDTNAGDNTDAVLVTVTADVLNVRAGAGMGYKVVSQVNAGVQLYITEVIDVSGTKWGRCAQGWLCLDYTTYDLVTGEQDENPSLEGKTYATIKVSAVNVRKGPGTSYGTVTSLRKGDVVEILELTHVEGRLWGHYERGWFRIDGYADLEVIKENEGEDIPGPEDPGVSEPTEPSEPEEEIELPEAPIQATILGTEPAVIRSGPHKTYPSLGQYAVDSRVEILEFRHFMGELWGRTEKGWIRVNHYVMLDQGNNLVNTFFVTIQTSTLNIRTGPGTDYGTSGSVKYKTELEIFALEDSYGVVWGRTYRGWINLQYTNYDPSMVPDQTPPQNCETLGHNYVDTVVAPTCTETGYTVHKCDRCGDRYTDSEVAALGHSYVDTVVAPTCTEKGYTTHKCGKCGHSYTDSEAVALGHSYVSVVTPPTTKDQGYTTHTCEFCGHSYVDSYTDPVKNTVTVTVTKTFAKITAGAVYVRKGPGTDYGAVKTLLRGTKVEILDQKTVSGKIWGRYEGGWFRITGYATLETVTETYEVEVDGPVQNECDHSYTDMVKAPTCTEKGCTVHTCGKCGHSYTDAETAATGHSYTSVVTPPTTKDQGYTTHTCKSCGHSYVDSYTEPGKEPDTETVSKVYATVTAGAVFVRKGPGASNALVTSLSRGDVVEIFEQKDVDGRIWGRYEKGWFRLSGYTTLETVSTEVPVPEKPSEPVEPETPSEPEEPEKPEDPEATTKVYATITAVSVYVRKGPGAGNTMVTTLRRGNVVEIFEQKDVDGRIWGRCEKGWFRLSGYATLETVTEP